MTIRHARHYPPMWGDIKIEPYTVWPVWEKSPDDYVILLREPLTRHMFGFIDDELPPASAAGDGWFGGVPEISPDKKTIYWTQYRMIQRHPPFRVAYDLPRGSQRHIVIWSSQDGLNWKHNFTTLPTEEDEIGTQHFGGSVKNLEGGRLKLLYQWVYRSARQQMRLELAYSRDGRRWHRLPGPPFSDNGPFGSWNYGFATDRDFPEIDKDGFSYRLAGRDSSALHFGWETFNRIDYAEITGEFLAKFYDGLGLRQMPNWGDWGSYDTLADYLRTKGSRTIGLLRYRKNGWVSLQPEGEAQGALVTKTLTAHELLSLNAKTAAGGSIRVEVLDAAGKPLDKYSGQNAAVFTGDAIDEQLAWSGGAVQKLPDGPFRLRLVLDRADLFAINFPHTSAAEAAKSAATNASRPAGELHVDPVDGDDAWSRLAGPGWVLAAAGVRVEEPLVVPAALRSFFTAPETFSPDRIPTDGSP